MRPRPRSRPRREGNQTEKKDRKKKPTFPLSNDFYRRALQRCQGDARRGGEEIGSILSAMGTVENRLLALQRALTMQALADLAVYANASRCLDIGAEFGGRIVEHHLKKAGLCTSGMLLAIAAGLLSAGLPEALREVPEEDRVASGEMVPEAMLKQLFGE